MILKVDALTGQGLMRLWGVHSWPDAVGDYWLWHGLGIFVVIEKGDHVELHMAMKKSERRHCRQAVTDILAIIGNRKIHAPIRIEHKQVCNLAFKFGFQFDGVYIMEFTDGTIGNIILMIKRPQ